MTLDVLELIGCPGCRSHPLRQDTFEVGPLGEPLDGVVWCTACGRWYPLEGGLLELLVEPLAYGTDRARFQHEHEAGLRDLELKLDTALGGGGDRVAEVRHQQEHFDWYADNSLQTYAQYEQLRFWQALDAITFARWRKTIRPGARLLDIGCAQGRSTFKVAGPDLDVVAFDISKALVRQAIDRADRIGASAHVTFLVADANTLPFVDESFDYVLTYGVLHHLPEPRDICREIGRILKPGGTFFCSENNRTVLRSGFELLQRLNPLWYEEAGEFAQISRRQLADWLGSAGLLASIRTSVFMPPHLLNHVPQSLGERALDWTDGLANAIPGVRDNGGLVVAEAVKPAAPR